MAQVSGHPNLVSLVGCVTSGLPLLLLLSYCEHGSLLEWLKARALAQRVPTTAEKLTMCIQIARAMSHLTECHFVHRDLAARNVLVDSVLSCKVADFGLSRGTAAATRVEGEQEAGEEEYYRSRTGTFPVRWTAPESMQTMRFATTSDVWSFGIVIVEIFTNGGKPYAGMDNAAVIRDVQAGHRNAQPTSCPDALYAVLLRCWDATPSARPTFSELVDEVEAIFEELGGDGMVHAVGPAPTRPGSTFINNAYAAATEADADAGGVDSSDYLDTAPDPHHTHKHAVSVSTMEEGDYLQPAAESGRGPGAFPGALSLVETAFDSFEATATDDYLTVAGDGHHIVLDSDGDNGSSEIEL